MTKRVDHGHSVTINSRDLHRLVEAVGGLLMRSRHKADDDDRRQAFDALVPVLHALDHANINDLRESYLNQPFTNDGVRVFALDSQTRVWNFRGCIEGTLSSEDRAQVLVDALLEAGFRATERK